MLLQIPDTEYIMLMYATSNGNKVYIQHNGGIYNTPGSISERYLISLLSPKKETFLRKENPQYFHII